MKKKDIIVVDYFDKISPGVEPIFKDIYERAKHTFEQLSQMAKDQNVAILLNAQPNQADLNELRKEQQAREKIKADSEAFDHFINTGEIKEIKPISVIPCTPGGEVIKYEPTVRIVLTKKRSGHEKN